jgi:ABC-type multidrug transport system fused ATPase/permease subunit
MKKAIIFVSAVVAFILLYFYLFKTPSKRDLQEQINQLQQEVAALQEMNGLPSSYEIENDSVAATKPSNSKQEKSKQSASQKTTSDDKSTVKTAQKNNEEVAVEAIKYCLKMYVPDLKYTNIRSVPQSDGTVDVVIDYITKYSEVVYHTYYNVTVYSNKEFRVNSCSGVEGDFPHHSKMMLP